MSEEGQTSGEVLFMSEFGKLKRGMVQLSDDDDDSDEDERVQPSAEHPDILVLCSSGPTCDAHPPSNVVLPAAHYTWQFRGACRLITPSSS